jgi:hypothetical protein
MRGGEFSTTTPSRPENERGRLDARGRRLPDVPDIGRRLIRPGTTVLRLAITPGHIVGRVSQPLGRAKSITTSARRMSLLPTSHSLDREPREDSRTEGDRVSPGYRRVFHPPIAESTSSTTPALRSPSPRTTELSGFSYQRASKCPNRAEHYRPDPPRVVCLGRLMPAVQDRHRGSRDSRRQRSLAPSIRNGSRTSTPPARNARSGASVDLVEAPGSVPACNARTDRPFR